MAVIVCVLASQVFACAAITKKGTRCMRAPAPGSEFCWQHGGKSASSSSRGNGLDALSKKDYERDVSPTPIYRQEKHSYCEAVYSNGVRCNGFANAGSKYCVLHVNYDPENPPELRVDKVPKTAEEKRDDTLLRLQKVEKAIFKYRQRGAQELPKDLATLNALVSTAYKFSRKDAWGTALRYEAAGLDYIIMSAGPDCTFDTEDDMFVSSLKK